MLDQQRARALDLLLEAIAPFLDQGYPPDILHARDAQLYWRVRYLRVQAATFQFDQLGYFLQLVALCGALCAAKVFFVGGACYVRRP